MGNNVTHLSPGDQVFGAAGLRLGTYGEYVALPARYTIVAKPRNMGFEEAAGVPLGGLNALHFMRRAKIQPGGRVLIDGAGGSIGTANPRVSDMVRSIFTTRFTNKAASFAFARETKQELTALKAMIESRKIVSIVDKVYPMERAADQALRTSDSR